MTPGIARNSLGSAWKCDPASSFSRPLRRTSRAQSGAGNRRHSPSIVPRHCLKKGMSSTAWLAGRTGGNCAPPCTPCIFRYKQTGSCCACTLYMCRRTRGTVRGNEDKGPYPSCAARRIGIRAGCFPQQCPWRRPKLDRRKQEAESKRVAPCRSREVCVEELQRRESRTAQCFLPRCNGL